MTDTKVKQMLTADKHPQTDLFICDVSYAVIKDIIPSLEFPFYSLSKKPDTSVRRYEFKDNWIEIVPSVRGAATIYDKDIMIYAISQLVAKLNAGEPISKRIQLNSYQLLKFTNRTTSGRDYQSLQTALDRLEGTRIRTNICREGDIAWSAFGLIDTAKTVREHGLDGRLLSCEIVLSDWVFDAIKVDGVLKLSSDYFRLRKPIERRIYELARKHCGNQAQWSISLSLLYDKTGSQSPLREFRRIIKGIEKNNHLPDYSISYSKEKDMATFKNKKIESNIKVEKIDDESLVNPDLQTRLNSRENRKRVTAAIMDIKDTDW